MYYKILYANIAIQHVCEWESGDFDIISFWKGKPFTGKIPKEVELFIPPEDEKLPRPAILPNPASWLIISDLLLEIWGPYIKKDVQVFDAPIFYESDHRPCEGYHIINPIRVVDCIDWERSKASRYENGHLAYFPKLILSEDRLPDYHIFRLKDYFQPIIASPTLIKLLTKDIKGTAFLKIQTS